MEQFGYKLTFTYCAHWIYKKQSMKVAGETYQAIPKKNVRIIENHKKKKTELRHSHSLSCIISTVCIVVNSQFQSNLEFLMDCIVACEKWGKGMCIWISA